MITHDVCLVTPRLRLREFCPEDFEAVHAYASDPEVTRFLTWGPNDEDTTRIFLRRAEMNRQVAGRQFIELAVTLRDSGALIGGCGLRILSFEHCEGEIGYALGRAYWGKGLATECAAALLRHGFTDHILHRITAKCDPDNAASLRVLDKIGMRAEGRLRGHWWRRGTWCDALLYSILEEEWKEAHPDNHGDG